MSASPRTAEIVGGGLGGLAAAVALGQRGWRVRVHERGTQLRDIGAGIYLWENVIRVLEALDVYRLLEPTLHRVPKFEVRDARLKMVQCMDFTAENGPRCSNVLRPALHQALERVAREHGAEIWTQSNVARATPDGDVVLEDGRRLRAELVLAADGVNSAVRESLGLLRSRRELADGAHRLLVPRWERERHDPLWQVSYEYWSGPRRIIYSPCAPDWIYIALSTRADDRRGSALPVDIESWKESFPPMAHLLDRIDDSTPVRWDRFTLLSLHRWSLGRVGVLGDAAHAQPPNLGQGAGLAMSNALALAVALDETADVTAGLRLWEQRERPLVEHTQKWSTRWGLTSTLPCPSALEPLRSTLVSKLARNKWIERNLSRTAAHAATGTGPQPA
jgi:2-polyprenyl-6-methoxyphenol hydroxylase-like FAD-dependent oxidoreductase